MSFQVRGRNHEELSAGIGREHEKDGERKVGRDEQREGEMSESAGGVTLAPLSGAEGVYASPVPA